MLTIIVCVLSVVLGFWAFYVAVCPPKAEARNWHIAGFVAVSGVIMACAIWQSSRAEEERGRSSVQLITLQRDLDSANGKLKDTSRKLDDARDRENFMSGQLAMLGVSVEKIDAKATPPATFLQLANAVSRLADKSSPDPSGLYDVSINGIPHQLIRIDHKVEKK